MTLTDQTPAPTPEQTRDGKATASLVLGIISIFINPLFLVSIVGAVLGITSMRTRRDAINRTQALVGTILSAVGVVTAIITLVIWFSISAAVTDSLNKIDPHTPVTQAAGSSDEPTVEDTPSTAAFDYTSAGITLSTKTKSKQCYGSAGCNVTVEVEVSVLDASTIPDDASGEVTFELTGDESGPITDTITMTGQQYTPVTENISTSSTSTKVHVKVTDIETD